MGPSVCNQKVLNIERRRRNPQQYTNSGPCGPRLCFLQVSLRYAPEVAAAAKRSFTSSCPRVKSSSRERLPKSTSAKIAFSAMDSLFTMRLQKLVQTPFLKPSFAVIFYCK